MDSRQSGDGLLSRTFECPSAGLSDPDTTEGLPTSFDLALCSCKSGADETHYRIACKAVN
jgi:hypothetical protein